MYGRIIDGKFEFAPNPITLNRFVEALGEEGKFQVFNPRPDQYAQAGYLEIIETAHPEEKGKYFVETYVEKNGKIYLEWAECDPPIEPTTNFETVNTTDETSVILRSSSPNSTKRFRLTIDDNGELFVNEIS